MIAQIGGEYEKSSCFQLLTLTLGAKYIRYFQQFIYAEIYRYFELVPILHASRNIFRKRGLIEIIGMCAAFPLLWQACPEPVEAGEVGSG